MCPNCSSIEVMPLGRVTAEHTGVRVDYRCRDSLRDFVLLR
ncbi:MAG TPA: hypothetical protein VGP61_11050 [Gemmatimonadales bacterium]|nr:hypothetical protein [Gemmatimonadales bacterium]